MVTATPLGSGRYWPGEGEERWGESLLPKVLGELVTKRQETAIDTTELFCPGKLRRYSSSVQKLIRCLGSSTTVAELSLAEPLPGTP